MSDKKYSFKYPELILVPVLYALGLGLRLFFFYSASADTYAFELWFRSIREIGDLSVFTDFVGDYNVPYIALMYFVTLLPFSDFVCVKLIALFFDLFGVVAGFLFGRELAHQAGENIDTARHFGELCAALIWLSPITIGNGGYQAQLEAMWAFNGFLAVYMFCKKRPVPGMIFFAISFAMKPQGIFFLPFIFLFYYRSKSFSVLHFLIVPAVIQVLSIPSMIGGNSFFYFWKHFFEQSGLYPFVYYYYPNIWIWMRNLPYYVFGKVGIGMMITAFLLYTVKYVGVCRKKNWTLSMDLELLLWSVMTCTMFLPAMHERYNYPVEVMLPVLAVFEKKYRIPAAVLVLSGLLCNGMSYYGWGKAEFYGLSLLNMAVYACLTAGVIGSLRSQREDAQVTSSEGSSVKGGAA